MILKRFTEAIKRQDWFQVVIEILIVVVGIFLGLQVSEWNKERQDRVQERVILNRMHSEVYEGLGYKEDVGRIMVFGDMQLFIRDRLAEVIDVFSASDNAVTLGSGHCQAIILSHIHNNTTVTLPTMTELLSTGQFAIIQSESLKSALSQYSRASETMTTQTNFFASVSLVLARKYPEFIKWDISARSIQTAGAGDHKCDFEKMMQSVSFNNDIGDNAAKQNAFVSIYIEQQEKFQDIHSELDRVLGITHDEVAP